MATLQDYLNMAVSLTIGNKSGTENQVFLPDDFRKFSDLKVKRYNFRTITTSANVSGARITSNYTGDSLALIFFSHPVVITHVNGVDITAKPLHTSFYAAGRNLTGSANFPAGSSGTNSVITFNNTLASPGFTAVTGSDTTEVDILALTVELEA